MPPRKLHLDAVAVAGLLVCCALWGLNQIVIKLSVQQIGPLTLSALRSLITGLLVLLWCGVRGIALFKADGTLKGGLLVGVMYACTVAFTYLGLRDTSASRFGVFLYLSPFIVALGMPLIEKSERLSLLQFSGLLVAFAGMALACKFRGFLGLDHPDGARHTPEPGQPRKKSVLPAGVFLPFVGPVQLVQRRVADHNVVT